MKICILSDHAPHFLSNTFSKMLHDRRLYRPLYLAFEASIKLQTSLTVDSFAIRVRKREAKPVSDMFKLRIPMAIIVSSGGLLLLIIGSLFLISSVAHTSETDVINQQAKSNRDENQAATAPPSGELQENPNEILVNSTTRRRGARFFNQDGASYGIQRSSQSEAHQQQQERSMSMESYIAALAAANSADHSNGSADLVQSTIPANDAASFGEQQPISSPAAASTSARQFEATEYSPVRTGSGSYHNVGSTSSSSNYLPNHLAHSTSGAYHYHQPHPSPTYATNHQQHYQSMPSALNHHYGAATKKVSAASLPPLGYPNYDHWSSSGYFTDRSGVYPPMPYWSGPQFSTSSGLGSSLMSSASSALSHWTGGFGVGEIICGIIAVSIGAVILGAPFFLIYLALMGNFSGSSTLSLTNPPPTTGGPGGSGTTTVNGRRKRLAIFEPTISSLASNFGDSEISQVQLSALADTVISQLSPFVDFQQVTSTIRRLVNSIEKYSKLNQRLSRVDKTAKAKIKRSKA